MFKIGDIPDNKYEIKERLGSGSGAVIFRAHQFSSNKDVAMKLIGKKETLQNSSAADILKDLSSEYLPRVLELVEDGGDVYSVMEFIGGRDLRQMISSGTVFGEGKVRKYAVCICEAVKYLHSRTPAIIHGNITPSNIMLTDNDSICLTGLNIGSANADISADIYGIGESVYYIMTGREISNGKTDFRGIKISNGFKQIILKALDPDPEKRFKSAEEMLEALRRLSSKKAAVIAVAGTAAAIALICTAVAVAKAQPETVEADNDNDAAVTAAPKNSSSDKSEDRKSRADTQESAFREEEMTIHQGNGAEIVGSGLWQEWSQKVSRVLNEQSRGEYDWFLGKKGYVRLDDYTFDDVPEIIITSDGNSFRTSAVFDIEGNLLMEFASGTENYDVYVDSDTQEKKLMICGSGASADYMVCIADRIEYLEKYEGRSSRSDGKFAGAELYRDTYGGSPAETAATTDDAGKLKKKYFGKYNKKAVLTSSGARWSAGGASEELSEEFFYSASEELVDRYIEYLITGLPNTPEGNCASIFDGTDFLPDLPETETSTEPTKPVEEAPVTTTAKPKEEAPVTTTTTTPKPKETTTAAPKPKEEAPVTTPEPEEGVIIIKGKKYSTDLTELKLSNKGLTDDDIKELSKMTQLTRLELDGNNISDISCLKNLKKLKVLSLNGNKISDISALKNLTNLTELYLDDNKISNISALNGLSKLKKLSIANNKVSDDTIVEYIRSHMPEDCEINY